MSTVDGKGIKSMEKLEIIQELQNQGYTAIEDKGIIMVTYQGKDVFNEIKDIVRNLGYRGSFGTKKKIVVENIEE